MSEPTEPPYQVTITARGVSYNTRGLDSLVGRAWAEVAKAFRLVLIDLKQQSFGLYFGQLWLLLEPALQAGAYYFLLSVVFRMQGADSTFAFFFIGITFWRTHATLLTTAPYFLASKGYSYIEQGFGLTPALLEAILSELVLLGLRLAVLFGFLLAIGHLPKPGWLALPLVVLTQLLFSTALFLILAMIGAAMKDIGKLVGHVVWLWWYMSPGLYSIARIPDWAMIVYRANPFFYIMPSYHEIILRGVWSFDNMLGCAIIAALSAAVLVWASRATQRFSYGLVHHI